MKLSPLLVLCLLLPACGSASYNTTKIKSYSLAVLDQPQSVQDEFRKLIDDFNAYAGLNVLTYAETAEEANSPIILTEGLLQKTKNKVGLGQWLSETKSDSPLTVGSRPKRVIRYSMHLDFDADYIRTNIGHNDKQKTLANQKLFFHEVGHGLEMNHNKECDVPATDADKRNLMYCNIDGDKDFPTFFTYVRNYMADQ